MKEGGRKSSYYTKAVQVSDCGYSSVCESFLNCALLNTIWRSTPARAL